MPFNDKPKIAPNVRAIAICTHTDGFVTDGAATAPCNISPRGVGLV